MMQFRTLLMAGAFLLAASVSNAQHPRMVVMEEFTSMTCPPCAQVKPIVEQFSNKDNGIFLVTYHMNYPNGGGDPFYSGAGSSTQIEARHSYYNVGGIPSAFINGAATNPGDLAGMNAAANKIKSKESPLLITVSEDRSKTPIEITVTVKNDGSQGISGVVLHTVLVNHYVDLTSKYGGKSNVFYSEFEDCALRMYPSQNGTALTLTAGESKNFKYTYTPGSGEVWTPGQQYVVAFVQEPNSKEVLQGGSNFFDVSTKVEVTSTTEHYLTTARNTAIAKEFTITNSKNKAVTVKAELLANSTIVPNGWTQPVLDKSTITIPANGTATVSLSSGSAEGGFLFSILKVTPQGTGIITESNYNFGYLAEGTKYGVLVGFSTGGLVTFNAALSFASSKYKDFALLPAATEIFNAYNPLPFEGIIVPVDYDHRGALYGNPGMCSMLGNLMDNGTRLLITAERDAYYTFDDPQLQPSPGTRAFLNSLGIDGTTSFTQRYTQSGNTITPSSFTVRGAPGDVVGGGITMTCNKPLQSFPYWNWFTDALKIVSGSKAVPFMYYDQGSNVAGVRIQTEKSRAVYLSFGVDAIESAGTRTTFVAKLMDWLMAPLVDAPAPDIEVLTNAGSSLAFGNVEIGKTKSLTLDIKNTGNADLTVTAAEWSSDEDTKVFSITSGGTFPMTIKPGQKSTLTVQFKPIELTDEPYQTSLTLKSNAKSNAEVGVQVTAKAVNNSTSVEPSISNDGLLSASVGPNPFSEQTKVNYTVAGSAPQMVNVRLIDALGNYVQTLAQGVTTPGTHTTSISGSGLAAGTYRVVVSTGTSSTFVPVVILK